MMKCFVLLLGVTFFALLVIVPLAYLLHGFINWELDTLDRLAYEWRARREEWQAERWKEKNIK